MKRREFIKHAGGVTLGSLFLQNIASCNQSNRGNKIIVLIQLVGGNDGLNTLIPLNDYGKIIHARPNLYIPEQKILKLSNAESGLHPSLSLLKELFDQKQVSFIQNVGYENPSYSHFRSADIWLTGSDNTQNLDTGWMARYLESVFPKYPEGYPNEIQNYPPSIKIGDTGTLLFQGEKLDMSIVINPYATFTATDVDPFVSDKQSLAGKELKTIKEMLLQTQKYSSIVQKALSNKFTHTSRYPKSGENKLADQLKLVSKLIHSGLETPVYLVQLEGFDTHDNQVDKADTTKGIHASLLAKLSEGISCFWDDVVKMGKEKEIIGITFSEFGRRIKSNASFGTDHGSSQPIILFGSQVRGEVIGGNPSIPNQVTSDDNLPLDNDYRAIFQSVLEEWFGASPKTISSVFNKTFPSIKLFKK